MRCTLLCAVILLCTFVAIGQGNTSAIQGRVNNSSNSSINAASVFLLKAADSSIVKFTITDENGFFSFNKITPDNYLITVSSTGYARLLKPVSFVKDDVFDVGIIVLKNTSKQLRDINISAPKDFVEIKVDKIILNISSSVLAVGNSALDVLKKSPGVQVDNNGEISLKGKPDVLIMIDGKPTYLTGAALTDLLQGTQSSMIDKIELISNPNSSYDAAGTGGVINIRLKKDKSMGINAQFNASAGVTQPEGMYDKEFRGISGLNFNYRNKDLNIFGAYSYSSVASNQSFILNRSDTYKNQVNMVGINWFNDQRRETNNIRLGMDYNVSANHIIGVLFNGVLTSLNGPKNTLSNISGKGVIDSTISTQSALNKDQKTLNFDVNYKGVFKNAGELNFDANFIKYTRKYNEDIQSTYMDSLGKTYRSLSLQNRSPASYRLFIFNVNYHLAPNKENDVIVGLKSGYAETDNQSNFGSVGNGVYTPYTLFTGMFYFKERINAAFGDYTHSFNSATSLELGLRVEQTISEGIEPANTVKNNYFDFFPNLQLSHSINADIQLRLSYSRRISRPRYEDINPLLFYNDQYTYQIGNPYLKPSYANAIELAHTYKKVMITSIGFAAINGWTQIVYMQNNQNQVTTLKKINLGTRYNYSFDLIVPLKFTSWYSANVNLDAKYQRFTSTNGDLDNGSPDVTLKISQRFKLPLKLRADLTAQYETPTTYGVFRYKANYFCYGSVSRNILNNKGSLQLMVDNIFNSDKNVYTSNYQNQIISGTQINIFRAIYLNFSYSFGSQTVKAVRGRNTGSEEEQGRVGN